MKLFKNIAIVVIGGLLLASCSKKIESLQVDPNNPSSVPPELILGNVLNSVSGHGSASLGGVSSWNNAQLWNQYYCYNYDYYGNNIYSWTSLSYSPYLVLKNVVQMEKEAASRGAADVNPYEAIGKFVKAYYYYNMTSLLGDVPQADALQGTTNLTPTYTSQLKVFNYVLNVLDTASSHFATLIAKNDQTLVAAQDPFYGGKLANWQKLVNSYKLRVLVALSKKSMDATLNVPAQFAKIVNNPSDYPVFASQLDDFKYTYDNTYNQYPFNPNAFGSIGTRVNMAATYITACTSIQDPRVFITAEPAWKLVGTDPNPAQFQYFAGASTGEPLSTMYGNANSGIYSFINRKRYWANNTGEPDVLVGYKELCFNIAEGMARGWASGNAEGWYKTGINESMKFYGIDTTKPSFTTYFLLPGNTSVAQASPYTINFNFNSYYSQPSVQLSATTATAVNQIVMQKYIAMFQNSGYEAYYNWRRTGIPAFQTGSGVGNNNTIPLRWSYPLSEQTQNTANYKAALSAQAYSADDLNQTMWLLK